MTERVVADGTPRESAPGTSAGRLMRIGEVAERAGMSLPTLRHYDETGLLSPSARTVGNFRLYSEADLQRLMVIRRMRPLGFTVEEMRDLLGVVDRLRQGPAASEAERERLSAALQTFIAAAEERRQKLRRHLAMADEFIGVLHEEQERVTRS